MLEVVKKHFKDFKDGVIDTFVVAPYAFGDFLGRLSGLRDWQDNRSSVIPNLNSNYYQEQAINEAKMFYYALKYGKKEIAKGLINDVKDKPFYYVGGIFTTRNLAKTIPNQTGKNIYRGSIVVAKIDNHIHELIENNKEFYDLINNSLKDMNLKGQNFRERLDNFIVDFNEFENLENLQLLSLNSAKNVERERESYIQIYRSSVAEAQIFKTI